MKNTKMKSKLRAKIIDCLKALKKSMLSSVLTNLQYTLPPPKPVVSAAENDGSPLDWLHSLFWRAYEDGMMLASPRYQLTTLSGNLLTWANIAPTYRRRMLH
jgi:hypothetical protein